MLNDDLEIWIDTDREQGRLWDVDYAALAVRRLPRLTFRIATKRAGGREMREKHLSLVLPFLLLTRRPKVVVSGELGFRSLVAVLCQRLTGRKVLLWVALSEHTERAVGSTKTRLRRWLVTRSDGVILHSESAATYMQSLGARCIYKYPQVSQVPGLPLKRGAQSSENRHARTTLLLLGHLTRRKGVLDFIGYLQADPEMARRISLKVVGSGPLRNLIEAQLELTQSEYELTEYVQHDELGQVFAECDALVFPSLEDEWGLVVNEALAAGLPVIGSVHAQSVVELVHHGKNGLRFDPTDHRSVRSALAYWLALDSDQRDAMGKSGLETIRSRATVEGLSSTFFRAMGSAIEDHGLPSNHLRPLRRKD